MAFGVVCGPYLPWKTCKHCGAMYVHSTHKCPSGITPKPETTRGAASKTERPMRTAVIPKAAY